MCGKATGRATPSTGSRTPACDFPQRRQSGVEKGGLCGTGVRNPASAASTPRASWAVCSIASAGAENTAPNQNKNTGGFSTCSPAGCGKSPVCCFRRLLLKIPVHQAGLNAGVVLVFAALVGLIFAVNVMVIDLADLDIRIDADGLDTEDLQRPVARKTDITKSRCDMDKQSQPSGGGTTPPAWGYICRCG